MGIREEELAGKVTGSVANPNALRSSSPIANLASTIAERAPSTDAGQARAAMGSQPGAALNAATETRAARVALGGQPGAALNEAVTARATRAAFGGQPGAALNEAVNARMGPPTPAPMRMAAQQPGAGLADAMAARTPAAPGAPMMAAQPRTPYSLTGESAPAAMPKPQTPALLQGAPGSAPTVPQTVSGADLAGAPKPVGAAAPAPAAAPAANPAATRAAFAQQPGAAVANAAAARNPLQGPPVPRPVSPPLTPQQLPGTAQWPNPNTGGAGAMSREASNWSMERQALAGPTQSGAPLSPAAQGADKASTVSRLRGMLGLGANATAATTPPGGGGVPPVPPTAAAPGAAPGGGGPGAIRQALNPLIGSSEQWAEFAKSKAGQRMIGTAQFAGKVAKAAPVVTGAVETATGALQGDLKKTAWGAADTAAGAALYTPAAPVAGAYLATRAAYEGGKALPESWRDAIGSGINKVTQLFGGGVDQATADNYARMNAEYAARQNGPAPLPAKGGGTPKPSPIAAEGGKQTGGKGPATPPPAGAPAPRQGDANVAALTQQYNTLQGQLKDSPVSRVVLGGGQSSVYYKDGSVHNLAPGEQLAPEVQQHLAIGNAMTQIENGTYQPPTPSGASGKTLDASTLSGNQKVVYDAASAGGVDPARALMIASIETGGKFNTDAKNPNSSAQGMFQMLKANRSGTPAEQADPAYQAKEGIAHIMATEKALTSALGRAPSNSESYMGHLFGASGATTLLNADANLPAQQVIASYDPKNAAAIVKNHGLKGMTVGDVIDKMQALTAKHYPGGQTFSTNTPMSNAAVVQADGAGAPASAPQAPNGRAPYDPAPVQILRGLQDTTAVPNGRGAGYTEVPTSIYQAGVRAGDADLSGRGPLGDYARNVVQGEGFAANPAGPKLAAEGIKATADENVATMRLRGDMATAEAARYKAKMDAENVKKNITNVKVPTGDVDPITKQPITMDVPHVYNEEGKLVPAVDAPKQYPPVIDGSPDVQRLRDNANNPQHIAWFDERYGAGAAKRALAGKGK